MANGYVSIPFPSVVYPSSPTDPPLTVANAAAVTALNAALASAPQLPGAPAPSVFGLATPPKVVAQPAVAPVIVNGGAHQNIQNAQLRKA